MFLFIIGLLLSIFVLVGNFGPIGFLPFGMIVAGVAIQWKRNVKTQINKSSEINTRNLTFIVGGLILILTMNYVLGSVLSVSFLLPPISQAALLSSVQFGMLPIYVYTLLFDISEEYLFRGVIMYWILGATGHGQTVSSSGFHKGGNPVSSVMRSIMRGLTGNQFVAVILSSLLWMIFHLFVYGTQPLVLAFVFFTGCVLGYITLQSNSIFASTSIHGVNNVLATGLALMKVAA